MRYNIALLLSTLGGVILSFRHYRPYAPNLHPFSQWRDSNNWMLVVGLALIVVGLVVGFDLPALGSFLHSFFR